MSVSRKLAPAPLPLDQNPTAAPQQRGTVRVADQLISVLRRHGIDKVFGIPGGTISPLFDALIDSEIEVVSCQHETMAVYAASGYARATGRPGVVAVTSGPGILNAITGIAAANLDEAPVVVLTGDVGSNSAGKGALQDGGPAGLDIAAMFRPITKSVETLWAPQRATAMLEQALTTANATPKGAAVLQLPVDLTQISQAPSRVEVGSVASLPLDGGVCLEIAHTLSRARRPLIMAGVGARSAGVSERLVTLAEYLRCPVFTDIEGKGVFPESHPLSLGVFGVGTRGRIAEFLREPADVLLTVGCRLDDTTTLTYTDALRPSETMIQLDHSQTRLGRSYHADIAIECDLAAALAEIANMSPIPDMQTLLSRDASIQRLVTPGAFDTDDGSSAPHDPRAIIKALQASLPDDTLFTTDIGNHLIFACQNLVIDRADGFFVSNGLGGMGSGIGNAVGLQMAHGSDRRVVAICGDGGLSMVGNELTTCVEREVPLTLAVLNDGRWGMVEDGMERHFGRTNGWRVPSIDIVAWARALGADAVRIERAEDLPAALGAERSGPLVLEFPIDPSIKAANPRVEIFMDAESDLA
jgi:acetolactate synthase-1/2/3 large subunit